MHKNAYRSCEIFAFTKHTQQPTMMMMSTTTAALKSGVRDAHSYGAAQFEILSGRCLTPCTKKLFYIAIKKSHVRHKKCMCISHVQHVPFAYICRKCIEIFHYIHPQLCCHSFFSLLYFSMPLTLHHSPCVCVCRCHAEILKFAFADSFLSLPKKLFPLQYPLYCAWMGKSGHPILGNKKELR